ncbi:MAG: PqqD family peptide modification chaperone [Hyphomicrobiales bacterium]|nr:PqqD family peptide modification chaperone [Hyphomicrobiales bacterium]
MADPFLSNSWYRVADLRPRLRGHTKVHRHRYRGQAWYVVQDHATGKIHRFTPAAYLVVARMDGERTIDEIWNTVVEELGDDAPTQDETIQLLSQLHAADMLQSEVPPNTAELLERHDKQARAGIVRQLKSPLSVKIPLWNPDRFLTRTLPAVRFLFGWLGAILWLAVVVPAMVLAAQSWPDLSGSFTDQLFVAQNVLLLAMTYPVVKALHELGHGYATKAFGGAVHEMGIMFLVLYPIPYVDATSASAFSSKWQRMLVGAIGILVEVFLAALAFYAWRQMEPGLPRAVAYDVMLICGVSTVLVNGNPLLRFDGYYVFADLVEIPNLGSRANRYWAYLSNRYLFAARERPFPAGTGERVWFLLYGPASFVYRMVILVSIVTFLATQLFVLGVLLAVWAVIMSIVVPVGKIAWHVLTNSKLRRHRLRAVTITFGGAAAVVALLSLLPVPLHTNTEGVIWLPDDAHVRARADGFVRRVLAEPGRAVDPGTPLVESWEPTLDAEIKVLEAKAEELELTLASELVTDRVQAEVTRKELEQKRAELARLQERRGRLVATSAASGTFILPYAGNLPGRFVREGEVMGYVVPESTRIARVVVPQEDIDLVRQRLRGVQVKIADRLDETISARIVREVPAAQDKLPSKALAAEGGGRFLVDPRDPDGLKTLNRLFQFDIELAKAPPNAAYGARVHVRFQHDDEPLGLQWYRRVRQAFLSRFDV